MTMIAAKVKLKVYRVGVLKMAIFSGDFYDDLDWEILRHSAVHLYRKKEILENDLAWFKSKDFVIHRIDCSTFDKFENDLSRALDFLDKYGYEKWNGSFDAMGEAFSDMEIPDHSGLVLCFTDYDVLKKIDSHTANTTLDFFEYCSRDHLLYGKKNDCVGSKQRSAYRS